MTDTFERPILFSGPMVRAILEGRKTQTRRLVRPEPGETFWQHRGYELRPQGDRTMRFHYLKTGELAEYGPVVKMPYGQPGDRLWVREKWKRGSMSWNYLRPEVDELRIDYAESGHKFWHGATGMFIRPHGEYLPGDCKRDGWRPSIHMPRWMSRITLDVTSVRVERLQDISELDCEAELGIEPYSLGNGAYATFRELWESINGKRAPWDSNPWVWVIAFKNVSDKVHQRNP